MTIVASESIAAYSYVPETAHALPWADLPTIDLSRIGEPIEAKKQGDALIDALNSKGFFYIVGFNISEERVNRQFALGEQFYNLTLDEKMPFAPNLDAGETNGYRYSGRCLMHKESGLVDRTEAYNIPKFNGMFVQNHPPSIMEHLDEVEQFSRDLHSEVLDPLLRLIAVALELPKDYFVDMHQYDKKSEDHLRWMKYSKFTQEENDRMGRVWNRGHTDLGTLTLLFRQPVAGLQIKDNVTGKWHYAKPLDRSITANACDMLSLLTGGYIKSTIHRVVAPPADQAHVDRLGVLYFSRPLNYIPLRTVKDSPVLNRLGYTENELEKHEREVGRPVPTVEEYTFAKQKWQLSGTGKGYENGVEFLPGIKGVIYQ